MVCLFVLVLSVAIAVTAQSQAPAQSGSQARGTPEKRVTAEGSIVVGAHLTPEEIEDGKINDAYQPLYHLSTESDCAQIVELCESKIIPMAETSKFETTRNKFLFLANRDIAGCDVKAGRYAEAQKRYEKLFEYIPVWPGTDDSDYPINYLSIGSTLIKQEKWKEAETALEKSLIIFDEQIDRASHSDSEFSRDEYSKRLKKSEAQTRNLLAIAYFRDDRQAEASKMFEQAYQEATASNARPDLIQQIVKNGRATALFLGNLVDAAKWEARALF